MPKNFSQKQIIIIGGVVLVVLIGAIVFFLNIRTKSASQQAITIIIWGTDSTTAFNDLIQSYAGPGSGTQSHITYVQIDPSEYREKLLAALAAGTGPDVFEISNRDLSQWQSVIAPIPATLSTEFNQVTLQSDFPDVVAQDFVSGGQIYALPLSIDTLAMIYNKDLFNTAGIATVPTTWEGLQADLPQLRVTNAQGQITQAALALGGSEASIYNAPDIIFLLMMQNGAQMTSTDGTTVTFASGGSTNNSPGTGGVGSAGVDNSGLNAFNYYLQFANANDSNYTWNDGMGSALASFEQGKTAVIFDYSSALPAITAAAPFLNYGVSAMPQPANATVAVNYPKYNGLAVSRDSTQIAGAWNFIINLTTSAADENIYTKDTGAPPALRSVIAADQTNPALSVFASQALTAQSWHESNSETIDSIMNTAIENVLNGAADSTTALNQAQTAMNAIGN
ncbi:MAG TPA: extracellular solute-binding protein [Candidatus Paceibacterota bacterium]|nr:extracellular solute-binding protein [Candidatus Paceibacterota bacterium]